MEILKIFLIEKEAHEYKDKFNKGRALYTLSKIKSYKVEKPVDIWFREQELLIQEEEENG